ncbi:T-cell ecto-ADP-ribosyltransferase 2-like [Myripristis murdjan]|uniref:T-cell ecto-ADP-ribosyltransferase 2-like n=1 Tax=Myripristis murdjan TaxID=586833 RepID=UPI001175E0D3|nr:T-cell ecto-ADP-ribosyltransferase 2-like [Myripristis murdjan]
MPPWERQTCQKKIFSMCAISSLVLLFGSLAFTVIFFTFRWNDGEKKGIQDMSHDPSDSMYDDCRVQPATVADEHMIRRWDHSTNSCQAWNDDQQKAKEPAHMYMEKKHSAAIYMYTSVALLPDNQDFKTAAKRKERTAAKETFDHCSLYFYLSEAIQILKHGQVSCFNTYYKTETLLNQNISKKQMRFSTFVLSSLSRDISPPGSASCFEIYTCFGAEITHYSALKQSGQVLIPPYEVFKVSSIQTDAPSCEVTYTLRSNLNCVYNRESNTLHPISAVPVDGFLLIIIISSIAIVSLMLTLVIVKVLENRKETAAYSVSSMHSAPYSSGVVI